MARIITLATLLLALLILTGCPGSTAHILRWDYVPYVGWRAHQNATCNIDCFDEEGELRGACAGCYDANKHPIPGCVPGHWAVAPEKAAIDAKIRDKFTEDHCRLTAYRCACMSLAWTDEQKLRYPACDPRKGAGQ